MECDNVDLEIVGQSRVYSTFMLKIGRTKPRLTHRPAMNQPKADTSFSPSLFHQREG